MGNETLGEWYLRESGGNLKVYYGQLVLDYRPGQAFFDSLTEADQEKIRGTIYDPYYKTDEGIEDAVEFLTRS